MSLCWYVFLPNAEQSEVGSAFTVIPALPDWLEEQIEYPPKYEHYLGNFVKAQKPKHCLWRSGLRRFQDKAGIPDPHPPPYSLITLRHSQG